MTRVLLYLFQLAVGLQLPPGPSVADLEFERLNGVWVAEATPPREIERNTPALLRMWDSPRWEERERAFQAARLVTPLVFRSVVLAGHHPSPEVRHQSERFLALTFRCRACDGFGCCRECGGSYEVGCEKCGYSPRCRACFGSGDSRLTRRPFDAEKPDAPPFGPADLFPTRRRPSR